MMHFGSVFLIRPLLPMNFAESRWTMQIAIDVTDEMRREAESRGMPVVDYVEVLLARGRRALEDDSAVSGAIERIRTLRAETANSRR
ncbi:MAG: hypothetical protein WAM85_19075 [Terracidiphilus sp.]